MLPGYAQRETSGKRNLLVVAVEGPANGQVAKLYECNMVQAQCFIFSVPAQVTESYNVVVTDQKPHCLFWVLGLGLKPSVCHSEPVRIRYARLNCYLTVEEYRLEVKSALHSAYSEVELCR
jgi:hypothetical protein